MELIQSISERLKYSICQFKYNNNNSEGLLCKILVQDKNRGQNLYFPLLLTTYQSLPMNEDEIIEIYYNKKEYWVILDKTRITYNSDEYNIFFVEIKKSDNLDINKFLELNEEMFQRDLLTKIVYVYDEEFETDLAYAFGTFIGKITRDPLSAIRNYKGIYNESIIKQSKTIGEFIKSTFIKFINKIQELLEYKNFENGLTDPFEENSNQILNTSKDGYKVIFDLSISKTNIEYNGTKISKHNSQIYSSDESYKSKSFATYNTKLKEIDDLYNFNNTKKIVLDGTNIYVNINDLNFLSIDNTINIPFNNNRSEILSNNEKEILKKLN